jgi:hypothetical protein
MPENSIDDEPHKLMIERNHDKEPIDWVVVHLPSCPTETYQAQLSEKDPFDMIHYTCRMQAVIDGNGIDDIENWQGLETGEYKIKSYYEYHPGEFGGTYGEDHEIGLLLVEDESHD